MLVEETLIIISSVRFHNAHMLYRTLLYHFVDSLALFSQLDLTIYTVSHICGLFGQSVVRWPQINFQISS